MIVTLLLAAQTLALVIGNNAPPQGSQLGTLHYADDDAAVVAELMHDRGADVWLLTLLDTDSQRLFPGIAKDARAPTRAHLQEAVTQMAERLAGDKDTDVVVFFSGHGSVGNDGTAFLTLADGALSRAELYHEVLDRLPARIIHLLVDACHAEAVVRPRGDAQAQLVPLGPADIARLTAEQTLAGYPHVGAFLASAADRQAHEWDEYAQGVFTHQVVSGLRGAADVNGDGRVEYSELHAFVAAANRRVSNPRARLDVVSKAPSIDLHAAIVAGWSAQVAWLGGRLPAGRFFIEDDRGVRLVDAHPESGSDVNLGLPARDVFLRAEDGEARVALRVGTRARVADVTLRRAALRSRGSVSAELERGLFIAPFGRQYYEGFVDNAHELAVRFDTANLAPHPAAHVASYALFGVAGAATAAAIGFGVAALVNLDQFNRTDVQKTALDAKARNHADGVGFLVSTGIAAAAAAVGIGVWKF